MGETLQALCALQKIDLQIFDIRQQLARRERVVAKHDKSVAEIRRELSARHDELMECQKDADRLDLDLKGRTQNVNKLRDQLNTVRTNKEYAAVLTQLNTEKAESGELEVGCMERLETVEKKRAEYSDQQTIEKEALERLEEARGHLTQTEQSFATRLKDLGQEREAAAAPLGTKIQTLFDRTSARFDGEAMARIVRTHPRRDEFICDGCNMTVAAERYNAAMTRDDVHTCRNCGRIFYIDKNS